MFTLQATVAYIWFSFIALMWPVLIFLCVTVCTNLSHNTYTWSLAEHFMLNIVYNKKQAEKKHCWWSWSVEKTGLSKFHSLSGTEVRAEACGWWRIIFDKIMWHWLRERFKLDFSSWMKQRLRSWPDAKDILQNSTMKEFSNKNTACSSV